MITNWFDALCLFLGAVGILLILVELVMYDFDLEELFLKKED